ncbi:MAG TPA: TRAP transporter substrate-binding protein DctP [Polyangiaceae bacterium]|nr:TRAP transporter substrate-binding protein DctP [Polyangiaceae bacterium]
MVRTLVMLFAAAVLAVGAPERPAGAATTLKIGTLAPQDSPWGKEFRRWAKDVSNDTGGELNLDFQWNGQAGDEVLMVQKIRTQQLDGAAVTAIGLAQTGVTDVLLFQMPGLFANWAKLDATRAAMKDEFDRQFEAKGFSVLGWGDVGAVKTMSVGFEVHHPADLQGKGCFFIAGDPIEPKFLAAIGGITPRQVTVNEILPGLTNGSITALAAPPLAAEQLQWASRVTHINTLTTAFGIGAIIVSSSRVQSLPQNFKDVLAARGREAADRLTKSIRNLDAQAFARLKATKVAYEPNEAEKNEWRDLFARVRQQLRGAVFTPAVFDRVVQLAQ